MLHTNGIPPKLDGRDCEELICQQYWQGGKLAKEVDVVFIKSHGRWYQLYFEDATVYWRAQNEKPVPFDEKEGDPIKYPLIDLGKKYEVKGVVIDDCVTEPLVDGAKVSLIFERGDKVIFSCVDNDTRIQFIKSG